MNVMFTIVLDRRFGGKGEPRVPATSPRERFPGPSYRPRRCSILITMPSASTPAERPPTLLESALRREHISAVVLLAIVPVFSWIWIVAMARDMYGPMTGAGAWMMTLHWDVPHLLLLWAMWTVMMTGMMLPSASPLIVLYGAAARRSAQRTATRQTYA